MEYPRPFSLVQTGDQWMRCSFEHTRLDPERGEVQLAWRTGTETGTGAGTGDRKGTGALKATGTRTGTGTIHTAEDLDLPVAGLAFDHHCRLYHSVPESGRIERVLWAAPPGQEGAGAIGLFDTTLPAAGGDFVPRVAHRTLNMPRGLAVDDVGRLFVAETGANRIVVFDLEERRWRRTIALPGAPTDLAVHGRDVYAVLEGGNGIVRFHAHSTAEPWDMADAAEPSRIACSPSGRVAVLLRAGRNDARVRVDVAGQAQSHPAPLASDVEWLDDQTLVIARRPYVAHDPRCDFLVWRWTGDAPVPQPPLHARGYDGRGIVATPASTPDGRSTRRIVFWTAQGFRHAVAARLDYVTRGRVIGFRLDSGTYQTAWGRVFVEACVPAGTRLGIHCITRDEVEPHEPLARRDPPPDLGAPRHDELSPPMPPLEAVPPADATFLPLHRRSTGRELPWSETLDSHGFAVYEAPVNAGPGRYLWIVLELSGDTARSPRVRMLRAERPGHDYLARLPRVFSRHPQSAHFLRRYLAICESLLGDLEARSRHRAALLHPMATPPEALPWLASFLGLVLDERWARAPRPGGPVDARREIVGDAAWLFRFRGTVSGLRRFLGHYVGRDVAILEHFRFRGLGGAMVGADAAPLTNAVLGAGFRVGGPVDRAEATPLSGRLQETFDDFAHRFTVLIPAALTEEELEVVERILETHRPAHTWVQICTVGAGMRVGRGLHVGMSSWVGPSGGFVPMRAGEMPLGRSAILGRPRRVASRGSRVGADAREWLRCGTP